MGHIQYWSPFQVPSLFSEIRVLGWFRKQCASSTLILQAGVVRVSCFASSNLLERVISRLGYLFFRAIVQIYISHYLCPGLSLVSLCFPRKRLSTYFCDHFRYILFQCHNAPTWLQKYSFRRNAYLYKCLDSPVFNSPEGFAIYQHILEAHFPHSPHDFQIEGIAILRPSFSNRLPDPRTWPHQQLRVVSSDVEESGIRDLRTVSERLGYRSRSTVTPRCEGFCLWWAEP